MKKREQGRAASRPPRPGGGGQALFGIDESMFALPHAEADAAAARAVDVGAVLAGLDAAAAVDEEDVDENDPVLLAALAEVQRGEGEEQAGDEARLAALRRELESEREAMALFEREGEDTADMRAAAEALQRQIAQLEQRRGAVYSEERFGELRAAAAAWHAAGDRERARVFLQQAKELRAGSLTALPPKPPLPPPPVVASVPPSASAPPPVSQRLQQPVVQHQPIAQPVQEPREVSETKQALERLRASRALRRATEAQQWETLLGALRDEARRANALALEFKETDKKLAVDCFRRQKETMQMLERALELRGTGAPPPAGWAADVPFAMRRVVSNPQVPEDGMLVHVLRGGDVATDKGAPTSSFVRLVYSYHPAADSAADQVFSSPVASPGTRAPEWNWSQLLPIQRKKTFQKWLERKDLRVELWESRGWLRGGDVLLGRVDVPVEPLLRRCTLRGVCPVMNNRKRVGPQIEVCVMLRTPLLGPEEDVREERWIRVPAWPEPGPGPEQRDEAEERRLEAALHSRAAAAARRSDPLAAPPWDRAAAAAEPEAPERHRSLAVLEFVAGELRRAAAQSVDPSGEAARRLARAQARAEELRPAASGPTYLRAVEQAIQDETSLAQHFKATGNKDAAIACLKRIKIMRAEVESLSAPVGVVSTPTPVVVSAPAPVVVSTPVVHTPSPPASSSGGQSDDADSADSIVSVAVIDFELSQLGSDEDSQLRKSELEIKRQMIILSIEMGTLTAEVYAAQLQRRIAQDRQLAKAANDRGDKARALRHLKRAKLMENELAS